MVHAYGTVNRVIPLHSCWPVVDTQSACPALYRLAHALLGIMLSSEALACLPVLPLHPGLRS